MSNTANLGIAYLEAAQSQKHVTMNDALDLLDALVQLAVKTHNLVTPPATPQEGDRHIVGAGAGGGWSGQDGNVAVWQAGAWRFHTPRAGWRAFIETDTALSLHDGAGWSDIWRKTGFTVAQAPFGAATDFHILEEEHTLAQAATSDTTIVIPARAIVHGVTVRVSEAVTGATSFDCGIAGETSKYGGSLGISLGSSNIGVTGPTAFYSDTAIRLSANGADFTGGKVRVAIHYMHLSAAD
ncbi:MAG TPA: ribonuclease III [Alphaproteobacteria bacterium]|nr:ribonuclease III [Alphaproteobacteria bacterium]HBA42685.1 ribonuclease III [Alphaproteobacteria bacterium]HBC55137.1 ribonuclease III [Alphaproteobacteria bacterium]